MNPVVRRVLLGNALSAIGTGLTMPLLIVYLGEVRGLGTSVAGLAIAWLALVSLVLLPLVGVLVDRVGPRPVLMVGLVIEAAGVALLTQVTSATTAFLVATVLAAGSAASWSPQSALLGRLTTPDERPRVFGIQFMLLNLGIGLGGLVAATIVRVENPSSFVTLYYLDALTYLLYVGVLLTLRGVGVGPAPVQEGADPDAGFREVVADRRLLRVMGMGLVLLTCGYGSLEVGLPVFITIVNDLAVSWVAVAYAVNTFSIVLLQLVTLRLIRGRSRSRLLAVIGVLWGLSWLVVGLTGILPVGAAIALILLSTFIFALGETLWAPIAPALVNDLAPDHLRGRYNSLQSVVWGISSSIGPALAGAMLGAGLLGAWVGIVVVGCLVASVMAIRLRPHLTPELDGRVLSPGGTIAG